jgi:hypothetical protein
VRTRKTLELNPHIPVSVYCTSCAVPPDMATVMIQSCTYSRLGLSGLMGSVIDGSAPYHMPSDGQVDWMQHRLRDP